MKSAQRLKEKLFLITKDKRFEFTMMSVIIFSALVIGIHTFDIGPVLQNVLLYIDYLITMIFVIEISFGQSASHAPVFVQLPKPSESICATIFFTRFLCSTCPCGN